MPVMVLALVLAASAAIAGEDELASIVVQEWGVMTLGSSGTVVSSSPGNVPLFPIGDDATDIDGYAVRAPVLYFNGALFTGTVTVRTDNGSIFDIYPPVADEFRTHSSVTWQCAVSLDSIDEYPDYRGMAPGEWNYENWRVDPANTISTEDGWRDKFLYYETAPETIDFLPYSSAMESVCDEYRDLPVLVIKRSSEGVFYAESTLNHLVCGGSVDYADITPDEISNVLFGWSCGILEPEQYEALWRTWSGWILYDHSAEEAYRNGMVVYMLPQDLCSRISTIHVDPEEAPYPVDLRRCILVALPL